MTIVYPYRGGLYLNLTNRCPTACRFCVKRAWRWRYRGSDLRLGDLEPTASEAWDAVLRSAREGEFKEVVYCGYGECAYRLPAMTVLGRKLRRHFPRLRLRLNTIGLGSLIWGRDIIPELRRCLDAVSVSLNTADPEQWLRLHAPLKPYRERGFSSVIEFIRGCARAGLETTVTAIDQPGVDLEAVRKLARELGAGFRPRPLLR